MAAPLRHFWDPNEGSCLTVATVGMNPDSTNENIVVNAWDSILKVYFPQEAANGNPTGLRYRISREEYRGPPLSQTNSKKPDVIVVKYDNVQINPGPDPNGPGPNISFDQRDVLWVECKPCKPDNASAWKEFLNEVVQRLDKAHPTRIVFLVLALGLKWMPFIWDPVTAPTQPDLQMSNQSGSTVWPVDPRIRQIEPTRLPNQTHIQTLGAPIILTHQAYSLDYWTPGQGGLQHLADLNLLERLFFVVQGTQFTDVNRAEWMT